MELKNKTIFIISYEEWGDMLMSKHHYAVELGRRGNRVYFINHTDRRYRLRRGEIKISKTNFQNVFSVNHRIVHPFFLKFKVKSLYEYLTGFHIKQIIRKIGMQPDVVWSFDAGNSLPLGYFTKNAFRIYMPVDGPFNHEFELDAGRKADIIVSVTERILGRYKELNAPKYQINHGVADVFINDFSSREMHLPIRIGYAGSLVRNDLDIPVFMKIITFHPDKIFEFWGENNPAKSTIHLPQDVSDATKRFLDFLSNSPNVIMHGAVKPSILAEGLKRMDALLIAYNIKNDQNHHKVLEYLGSGKVIISSYMSSYVNNLELLEMVTSIDNNDELPALFDSVINRIEYFNSQQMQEERIRFAKQFTYSSQVRQIEKFIVEESLLH